MPFTTTRLTFSETTEFTTENIGQFEGERLARSRGYREDSTVIKDTSSLLSVIVGIVGMYLIIGAGFWQVLP